MRIQINSIGLALCVATATLAGMTGCAGDRYHESTGEYIDDSTLTAKVKDALGKDAQYKYDGVRVTTFKGAVQLNGFVATSAQKHRAADLAREVPNVREVINNITVKD